MDPIKKYIGVVEYDANFYGILTALIVVLITLVIYLVFRQKRVNRRNVLITGLSDSGKTLLFSRLSSSKKVVTYTSMKENIAIYKTDKKKTVTLVDIPGNERLRNRYFDEFLPLAKGIIFVIDSLNFSKEIRDVAGLLYALFGEPSLFDYKIPFLIVCNKQDHAVAKSAKVVQSQLEKEINVIRVTQTGRLASTSASGDMVFLGVKGKDFQFSDLKPTKIEFLEFSASEPEERKMEELKAWVSKVA